MADYIIHRDVEYLEHFGIKGQKWGVRRFENKDGTLTEEGKRRYSGGPIGEGEYKKLKSLREDVRKANEIFDDSRRLKSKYGVSMSKADEMRTQAYRKLDAYGEELVNTFAKKDDAFKAALNERKKAEEIADAEWERINDPEFINKIATDKKDPRHSWFDKVGDHYEWGGDGTEYWEQLASKEAQDRLYDSEAKYRRACHDALCKMFSNVMDRPVEKAVREKDAKMTPWGTELMRLPVTNRMAEYMTNYYNLIPTD